MNGILPQCESESRYASTKSRHPHNSFTFRNNNTPYATATALSNGNACGEWAVMLHLRDDS
jgi:hypothetical protein